MEINSTQGVRQVSGIASRQFPLIIRPESRQAVESEQGAYFFGPLFAGTFIKNEVVTLKAKISPCKIRSIQADGRRL